MFQSKQPRKEKRMEKHAFLIMAHNDFSLLQKLITLLDDPYNDIYLHIDKKADKSSLPHLSTKYSKLQEIPSTTVNWGGHSQIFCELNLLKCATQNSCSYCYYHLLSGVDLPIKNNQYIKNFFELNKGKKFIITNRICEGNNNFHLLDRIKYYYFLQNKIGRNAKKITRLYEFVESFSLKLQKKLKISRKSCELAEFYKGGNWFSITHDLATYIVEKETEIKKSFSHTHCADEIFLQTMAMHSPYKDSIISNNLRYIDWKRGQPYTFQIEDYDLLMKCDKLFARKFSSKTDLKIIDKIYKQLLSENNK